MGIGSLTCLLAEPSAGRRDMPRSRVPKPQTVGLYGDGPAQRCTQTPGGLKEEDMKVAVRRIFRTVGVAVALVVASLPFAGQAAFGATGTVLADFVPGGATGNGRGVAFDGTNLWYTIVCDPHIYQVT